MGANRSKERRPGAGGGGKGNIRRRKKNWDEGKKGSEKAKTHYRSDAIRNGARMLLGGAKRRGLAAGASAGGGRTPLCPR